VSERIMRPLALLVVSVLLVALAAGAALAQDKASEIRANSKSVTTKACLIGTNGNDWLDDYYYGYNCINPKAGDDTVFGWTGDDYISGSAGGGNFQNDELGNDKLYGESGKDYIIDWYGYDKVYGGYDNDTINVRGGSFSDYVDCGPGYDKVYSQSNATVYNCELVYTS
jgi:Ca2+-binding RTX toxin-like protein